MLNKHLIRPAATLAVAGLLAAPAFAGDTADELEDRFGGLDYEPVMDVPDRDVRTRVNKFRVETEDGRHRFGIRGRLMTDFAYVDDNYKTTDDERADRGDLAKYGTIIRRARLGALGIMYDNWEWQLEVDFRDDEIRFANAYMAYLFDSGRLAVGHFKEPFSLESSTSSRRISFIERAAPVDAYRPSRQIGIMYETLVPNWYGAFGVFGGDGVARDRDVTEGFSVAARASIWVPPPTTGPTPTSTSVVVATTASMKACVCAHDSAPGRWMDVSSARTTWRTSRTSLPSP
jgi:phosphate-selective porin OprO and OprP